MFDAIRKFFSADPSSAPVLSPAVPLSVSERADLLIAEGNRAEKAGDLPGACERYRKAVEIAPRYANAHLNLGIGLEAGGNLDQARECFEAALGIDPANIYANYNLGRQLFSRNALADAQPLLQRAIAGNPDFADARVVLSALLETRGELGAAAAELEQALRVRPDYFGALCNYADLLVKLHRMDEAVSALRSALASQPRDYGANFTLARLLVEMDKPVEAEQFLQQALRSNPDSLDAHAMLVNLHMSQGDLQKAATAAQAALKLSPDWLDLLYDYGLILKRLVNLRQAEAVFRRAIEIDRTYWRAYQMLGAVQISQGRIQDALATLADGRQHCTDAFDMESAELFASNCTEDLSIEDLFARHVNYGTRLETIHPARFAPFENLRDPDRRLRIGYVSADFQRHVVSLFLMPLLEERDRSAFEVYCYSTGDTSDKITDRLRSLTNVWRDSGKLSPNEVADLIHRDRIDILIDLSGHSGVSNLRIFAQQPAPIQATWLGYLNTTGLSRIQYRISDRYCDPPGLTERFHTEELFRLPHSQWCYRPFVEVECQDEAPVTRNGYITFGSFNQTVKITATVRKLWGEILARVADARLVIVGVVDERTGEDLFRDLEKAGVKRERITMVPYVAIEEYYQWFARVDIALDTMPFSGGTTTCDALYLGAPVITLPAARSWSRSAASILSTMGLQECIAESAQDYVQRAVQLAQNPVRIAQLRKSLRQNMINSPLMDQRLFARDMDNAFRSMWRAWCSATGD